VRILMCLAARSHKTDSLAVFTSLARSTRAPSGQPSHRAARVHQNREEARDTLLPIAATETTPLLPWGRAGNVLMAAGVMLPDLTVG